MIIEVEGRTATYLQYKLHRCLQPYARTFMGWRAYKGRVYGPTNRVSVRVRVWMEKNTCKYTVGGTATEIQSDYLYDTVSLLYGPSYKLYSFDFPRFLVRRVTMSNSGGIKNPMMMTTMKRTKDRIKFEGLGYCEFGSDDDDP